MKTKAKVPAGDEWTIRTYFLMVWYQQALKNNILRSLAPKRLIRFENKKLSWILLLKEICRRILRSASAIFKQKGGCSKFNIVHFSIPEVVAQNKKLDYSQRAIREYFCQRRPPSWNKMVAVKISKLFIILFQKSQNKMKSWTIRKYFCQRWPPSWNKRHQHFSAFRTHRKDEKCL